MKTIQFDETKYKLVPIIPTGEMVDAALAFHGGEHFLPYSLYSSMLDAAPAAEEAPGQDLTEIEQYRMQMAGICTAALGYWKEGDGIHPDYDTPALREVARLYAKYAELYAKQQPAKHEEAPGQEPDGLPMVIAGALFDFAGFLTTREKVIDVGSTANAAPVADLVKEWAELRGLSLDDAAVLSWQEWLKPQQPATHREPVLFIHPDTFAMNNAHVGAWKPGHELEGYIPLYIAPQPTPAHIKAMQQALEALEISPYMSNKDDHDFHQQTITALQNALKGTT